MILYIEKEAKPYNLAQHILKNFPNASCIEINNYKNIFDKKIPLHHELSIIIAKLNAPAITKTPPQY
jgi:hypothetical protein